LRIGGGAKIAPPVEEEMPVEEAPVEEMPMEEPEMPVEEPPMESEAPMGLVDPMLAGYKDPEMGPFMCGNCQYYAGEGTCTILASPVDENGLCNLFMGMAPEEEEPVMDEMAGEMEPPMEEPELPAEEMA
jgi:hypothetical protein